MLKDDTLFGKVSRKLREENPYLVLVAETKRRQTEETLFLFRFLNLLFII